MTVGVQTRTQTGCVRDHGEIFLFRNVIRQCDLQLRNFSFKTFADRDGVAFWGRPRTPTSHANGKGGKRFFIGNPIWEQNCLQQLRCINRSVIAGLGKKRDESLKAICREVFQQIVRSF
ncbi:hypothetical protein CEXT_163921 [Caerostris extrusa]|uniref:Uncharacterized protein n=1 Tax=Caerostris extrusa TaxID=172846 RepID=A0AAV4T1C8_CAEEX|nr:hypothetical protein CEXT_163921 [Caerostris extrusa]